MMPSLEDGMARTARVIQAGTDPAMRKRRRAETQQESQIEAIQESDTPEEFQEGKVTKSR